MSTLCCFYLIRYDASNDSCSSVFQTSLNNLKFIALRIAKASSFIIEHSYHGDEHSGLRLTLFFFDLNETESSSPAMLSF